MSIETDRPMIIAAAANRAHFTTAGLRLPAARVSATASCSTVCRQSPSPSKGVRLGFRDASDLTQAIEGRFQADATVWLLHLRRAGTSLAMIDCETSLQGVNLAVCYCREASFPEPLDGLARTDPVTVVHELLHLFGATDKYNYPLKEFERGSVSSREVMRLSEVRLSRLRVDRLTAREIGWVGSGTG